MASLTIDMVLEECPEWFHSIELAPNVVTPGRKSAVTLARELRHLRLPDLHGKSVLDIGAYDGFFSFAVERLNAERVVALDHYIWSVDMAAYVREWEQSKRTGRPLPSPHESTHWRPDELPGRRPFDLARRTLESKVEPVVGNFMTMDLETFGPFDVVLFLGVLYHMENPLATIRRLREITPEGGLAIIETEAIAIPGHGCRPCCEFLPGAEINNDPSNWWVPNAAALRGLCLAAGFRDVTVFRNQNRVGAFRRSAGQFAREYRRRQFSLPAFRYRAFAHAIA